MDLDRVQGRDQEVACQDGSLEGSRVLGIHPETSKKYLKYQLEHQFCFQEQRLLTKGGGILKGGIGPPGPIAGPGIPRGPPGPCM